MFEFKVYILCFWCWCFIKIVKKDKSILCGLRGGLGRIPLQRLGGAMQRNVVVVVWQGIERLRNKGCVMDRLVGVEPVHHTALVSQTLNPLSDDDATLSTLTRFQATTCPTYSFFGKTVSRNQNLVLSNCQRKRSDSLCQRQSTGQSTGRSG